MRMFLGKLLFLCDGLHDSSFKNYIKNNLDNFSIVQYFQQVNTNSREVVEHQFKETIKNIIDFKAEKKITDCIITEVKTTINSICCRS